MSRWFATLAVVSACSTPDPQLMVDATPDTFNRTMMLEHLANNVLLPLQATVAEKTATLPGAITSYCDALDAGQVGTTLEGARAAWAASIDAWEGAEAVLVGPAAMDNLAQRNLIYSWPLLSPCNVDRDTASRWTVPASYDIATKPINQRSLTAIEYLLYPPSATHNCLAAPDGWDALAADLPRARCRLAAVIAADVAAHAAALHTAWRADGGDYAGLLSRAGASGSRFASAHAGVNEISSGFMYVDRMVKDMKLGEPAGIIADNGCGAVQEPCLLEVELRYGDRATFAIRANLAALRAMFTGMVDGVDGPGFDDFLRALGHPEVADRMLGSLDATIAAATAMPDSFLMALSADYASVVTTHTAIRLFTDDLKTQFLTVLALEIPGDVPVDND